MDRKHEMSRRGFVVGAAGLTAAGAWQGAAAQTPATFKESPMLAERVRQNQLPPVAQRLPQTPLVVKPHERVGRYGGVWRQAMRGGSDNLLDRTIGYVRLVRWDAAWTRIEPDICERYEVNADASVYTFHLRKGMRWSDGQPFTADDILFWYEDVLMNRELTPAVPRWLRAGQGALTVEKRSETEVVFRFPGPNGQFLANMATNLGSDMVAAFPKHYLSRFHRKYNADGLDALVRASGQPDWVRLFTNKITFPNRWRDAERPVLDPWKLTVPYVGTTRVTGERNAFFYKVDPDGNQLPYIDRVAFDILEDQQAIVLKAINGEIDMQTRHLDTTELRSVLVENQRRGNYRLFKAPPAWSNALLINFNQTTKNATLREVFSNKQFRIALSHAIDREELNQIIYVAQSAPWQAAPRKGTKLYDEKMATQYTQFDLKLANDILDKAGFAAKDSGGFRLGPNRQRISFTVDVLTSRKWQIDALQLIKGYWAKVGVEMNPRPMENSLAITRLQANDHDVSTWIGGGGLDLLGVLDPKWYFPQNHESAFATGWALWYQNPRDPNAVEPSAAAKRQMELHVAMQQKPSLDEQIEVLREIIAIAREEFYVIGTNLEPDLYGVVSNRMRNVPGEMPNTFFYMTPGPTNPEQYFFER
jgi:peptide/nickel transport system substrate-binding protein